MTTQHSEGLWVSAAVEGLVDEAVVHRLLGHVDAKCTAVYGKEGKQRLLQRLSGYNDAASMLLGSCSSILTATRTVRRRSSRAIWRLHRLACASALRCAQQSRGCLPTGRGAQFLGVAQGRLPGSPERLDDPKREVVALARRSRHRSIRQDLVPRPTSGRVEGPLYTTRLIEFVGGMWNPDAGAERCESLARCLERLSGLATGTYRSM